jgi:hypothetical protein
MLSFQTFRCTMDYVWQYCFVYMVVKYHQFLRSLFCTASCPSMVCMMSAWKSFVINTFLLFVCACLCLYIRACACARIFACERACLGVVVHASVSMPLPSYTRIHTTLGTKLGFQNILIVNQVVSMYNNVNASIPRYILISHQYRLQLAILSTLATPCPIWLTLAIQ